ncbi:MAG TPA: radical SAM family heme chaperone HemW [Rubricoccaceae bacterium]|nr:radical SAM family heme chaperone HemW [Rubricoccaceae bacterium]
MAGLYLHVPFCARRCIYCDFYFVTSPPTASFTRAMEAEIEAYGRQYGPKEPIETIYFGGGTPSRLPLDDVARLLAALHRHFDTAAVAEVTFEANPEDVTPEYLAGLKALGVTRLSLGVQSFFDEDLRWMNRAHDAAQAEAAVEAVAAAGFSSFSLDLIFGLPEQPFEHWGANLEKALRLGAPHLSTYSLTVEEQTSLGKQVALGRVVPAGDTTLRERFLFTMEYLETRGLRHYEVSSFARPGAESNHNSAYWAHRNYLGFGPSAHSFWKTTRSKAERWANVRHLGRYEGLLAGGHLPLDTREPLGPDALAEEAILLGLRRLDTGLDLATLERDYGVDLLAEKPAELAALEAAGLIHSVTDRVRLTREGACVADAVALKLV